MAQHVRMHRKVEAGSGAKPRHHFAITAGGKRRTALRGEHEGRTSDPARAAAGATCATRARSKDVSCWWKVSGDDLVIVVAAIANAAKTAVEETAMHLAVVQHADYRAALWSRLEVIHGKTRVERSIHIRGSSDSWEFDAAVKRDKRISVFEIVVPNANAVNSAVTKFLDVKDLGKNAPNRVAVLTNKDTTPHLSVLARTAKWLPIDASDDAFRAAA